MATNSQNLSSATKNRSDVEKSLDRGFIWLTKIFAFGVAATLLWIGLQVAIASWPAIQKFGASFLANTTWNPVNDSYGVLPQIYGTLLSSFIGLLIAVPIGVGTAIVLSEDFYPQK